MNSKSKENSVIKIAFTGGGTGGHIYPGLAVADSLRKKFNDCGKTVQIHWIGNSSGMDKTIVEKNIDQNGAKSADFFYGIPSGKLRRYLSFKNFLDLFKIFAGFASSFFILLKIRPQVLFSKGGFVSVPPCISAKLLGIPVFTHECDFTPGLATRINSRSASKILVSFSETKNYFSAADKQKVLVTGNPVRPVFYSADAEKGLAFLGLQKKDKPVLFVQGGSLGARQINSLIQENLEWLCERFIVIHQTGNKNTDQSEISSSSENVRKNYKPFPFIYSEMPDVMACADIVVSRAGSNSLWECSVLGKPMVLIPLTGNGTRGDQEDNADFFDSANAAIVLKHENVCSEKLNEALNQLLQDNIRKEFADNSRSLSSNGIPAENIASILFEKITSGEK